MFLERLELFVPHIQLLLKRNGDLALAIESFYVDSILLLKRLVVIIQFLQHFAHKLKPLCKFGDLLKVLLFLLLAMLVLLLKHDDAFI